MKGSSAALVLMAVLATAQLAVGRAEAESAGGSTVGAPAVSPNRLELEGFSILPPQGDGWQRLSSNGVAHLLLGFDVLYVKTVSPTELSHAYVVAHRVPCDSENSRILEDSFTRLIESRGTPSVIIRSSRDSPSCLRWEMVQEARDRFQGVQFGNWVTKYISPGDPPIAQNGFGGTNPWGEWGRRHQCGHGRCAGCWRTGGVAG
jgi:hypothetical protein